MDSQILRELLSAVIEASELLGVDAVYRRRWREILATLPALKVRQDGTIQEWEDFSEDCDPGHRHLSHLFGLCSGIAEMLLQSHGGIIRLLPALPSGWKSGEVHGLRARRGLEVSMRWSRGQLLSASLLSRTNREVRILSPAPLMQNSSLVRDAFGSGYCYRASLKGGRKFTLRA